MNHRERVLTTLSHREPDRVPRRGNLAPPVVDLFRERTGHADPAEYWDWDFRYVRFLPPYPPPDLTAIFGQYFEGLDCEWVLDWQTPDFPPEWGVATRPAHFLHLSAPLSPMRDRVSMNDLETYPFPDYVGDWRHDHLEAEVQELKDAGYPVNCFIGWVFQTAWTLRSQEKLFLDLYDSVEFAEALLKRITDIRTAQAVRFAEAGVDLISMNDDVGSQKSMMMSPGMWRRWLKPNMASLIEAVHGANPDVHFCYHSDGVITPIIPDLIEIGVSLLVTVQPECMDIFEIKRRFGDHISLSGTIGVQSELMWGTSDEVRHMVRAQCEGLMPSGGFIASPANAIEPGVPWENLVALFDALDAYGSY